jgi:hypothetical protein
MNSLLLGFIFYILLVLLLLVIDPCIGRNLRLASLGEQLRHMLFYNLILSMLAESYSMIALSCMIGLNKLSFTSSYGETIQSLFCIFALLLIIIYPIRIFWILR